MPDAILVEGLRKRFGDVVTVFAPLAVRRYRRAASGLLAAFGCIQARSTRLNTPKRSEGQLDSDRRPLARRRAERHGAAVGVDGGPDDGEAEARAASVAGAGRVGPVEPLEGPLGHL